MGRVVVGVVLLIGLALVGVCEATETTVVVRAKSKDAKFIGTSMGGAQVTVRRSDDGRVLAQGLTTGGTGDTTRLMIEPLQRGRPLADATAAKFEAAIDIDEPTRVTIEARAPGAQPQSLITSSTEIWVIPGKHVRGDGVILEIPGLAVDVLMPQTPGDVALKDGKAMIPVTANVVMMCGCPIERDGLWNAVEYEVAAMVKHGGSLVRNLPLSYAGTRNTFEGRLEVTKEGAYELVVYAFHASTGNSGVDRATVSVK